MNHDISCIACCHIGLTMELVKVRQLQSGEWEATQQIGTIFGSEVEGECSGTGTTKEAALEALEKDVHNLSESLWA